MKTVKCYFDLCRCAFSFSLDLSATKTIVVFCEGLNYKQTKEHKFFFFYSSVPR